MANFWKNKEFKERVGQEYLRVDVRKLFVTKPTVTLYHVSLDSKLPETLVPRLPYVDKPSDEEIARQAAMPTTLFTEPRIPRVSFSSTIEGALRAIYVNWESVFEQAKGRGVDFVVYELVPGDARFVAPETLARRAIHDAVVTQEWWALDPVQIKLTKRMTLNHNREGDWISYKPFGGKELEHSPRDLMITERK